MRSQSPVELSLGVDLSGGQNWQAASATWHPWNEIEDETWVRTQVFVRASAETLSVLLKGPAHLWYRPARHSWLLDDVRVADLGCKR